MKLTHHKPAHFRNSAERGACRPSNLRNQARTEVHHSSIDLRHVAVGIEHENSIANKRRIWERPLKLAMVDKANTSLHTFAELLEKVAPGRPAHIRDFKGTAYYSTEANSPTSFKLRPPEIEPYRDEPKCGGIRFSYITRHFSVKIGPHSSPTDHKRRSAFTFSLGRII